MISGWLNSSELSKKALVAVVGLLAVAMFVMDFGQGQSATWVSPYLSAAANYDIGQSKMMVDISQMREYEKLDPDSQRNYVFPKGGITEEYDYLALGFLFVILLAKKLFFFAGDLQSIVYLQYVIHAFTSLVITVLLQENYKRVLFLLLYAFNPLVLYFVNFPYYYYWQVVPSFFIAAYFLSGIRLGVWLYAATAALFFIFLIRPTVIFIILWLLVYSAVREGAKHAVGAFILLVLAINLLPGSGMGPWHTMYIGLGAYENSHGIELSDESGYKFYSESAQGDIGSHNIHHESVRSNYYEVVREEYTRIATDEWLMVLRNSVLNVTSAYSIGYKAGNTLIQYFSSFTGLVLVLLLLYFRQFFWFFSIGIACAGFALYYPPIAAYMFGSYILIVLGVISILQTLFNIRKTHV